MQFIREEIEAERKNQETQDNVFAGPGNVDYDVTPAPACVVEVGKKISEHTSLQKADVLSNILDIRKKDQAYTTKLRILIRREKLDWEEWQWDTFLCATWFQLIEQKNEQKAGVYIPSRKHAYIVLTALNHFYTLKLEFTGVYISFLISAQKQIVGTR